MNELVVAAPAKINLRLAILTRESDGFHEIETLFARLQLADEIRIATGAPGIRLTVEGAELGDPEQNLVTRAVRAWAAATDEQPHFDITLVKRIPAGSGLGGGSSDAAAILVALNEMSGRPLDRGALLELGGRLGSDVPFFIAGAPLALATGRGDQCRPLPPPSDRAVLLAVADAPMSTARAYALVDEASATGRTPRLPDVALPDTWDDIAAIAHNDFEAVLLPMLPGAGRLLEIFRSHGSGAIAMTGSGSAVFAIYDEPAAYLAALESIRSELPRAWFALTRTDFGERLAR